MSGTQLKNKTKQDLRGGPSFRGVFQHALDEKGRVSVPIVFRQVLGEAGQETSETLILTNAMCDGARCLDAYRESAWQEFEAKLYKRSRFDPQVRKLENYYLARASECFVDGSGRITVPTHLRQYAGLEREVVFAASLHGFRLWEKRVWEHVFEEAEAALLENPSLFMDVDR